MLFVKSVPIGRSLFPRLELIFFDYLTYFDGSDKKHKLVAGELIPMSLATGKHAAIMKFLEQTFDTEIERLSLPWIALQGTVGVRSVALVWIPARIPDMTVMLREALLSLQEREAAIDVDLKAPLLVIKVGSPSIKCIEEKAGDKI